MESCKTETLGTFLALEGWAFILFMVTCGVWKWVKKYSNLSHRIKTDRHHSVKAIFVDETMIQIDGQDYWLWIAYEPNLNYVDLAK
jgi:transposase-like protein